MTTWHAPSDTLARFARHPESLDDVTASSVEQHLIGCADCRGAVARAADPLSLRSSWDEIADVIDRPTHTFAERVLNRLGMPPDLAQVVGATPGMRVAWFATTVLLATAAILVARDNGTDAPFLVLAPLVPLGAVLLAFFPTEEPGGEAAAATPMFGAALVMRRVLAVLVPTFAILAAAGLAQPNLAAGGALWVLPGLALVLGSLALATFVRVTVAAGVLAGAWLTLLASVSVLDGRRLALAHTAVFEAAGQSAALAIALIAAAALYARRDHFSTMEVTW
ncbi:MAG: hypothetical protein ACRDZU_09935 [Acidimicrobiales bacterium]